jgi:2-polyprenyl-6-hydroxyphenyl methylase/3-demethylubiquinone-9 3-methyltransferase
MTSAPDKKEVFAFGKNWKSFLPYINEESVRQAENSLKEFIPMESLAGKSFIDIGCGSGLSSLAAFRLGAAPITSIDVDEDSVACCQRLRDEAGSPDSWRVLHGSVLDKKFLASLGMFDVVYSWGVLHHTGDMWPAIRNAADLVNPGGYFYIALYNKTYGLGGSERWARRKRAYVHASRVGKVFRDYSYMAKEIGWMLLRFRNPITFIRSYRSHRGMSWRRDVSDWLGGYPFEYASVEEVFRFMKKTYPDFVLQDLKTTNYIGNNHFIFKRTGTAGA